MTEDKGRSVTGGAQPRTVHIQEGQRGASPAQNPKPPSSAPTTAPSGTGGSSTGSGQK